MATLSLNQSSLGSALMQLLTCDDIQPGDDPSYQLCKAIYSYHPLGKKLADAPVTLAMSQPREISVPAGPDRVREAFVQQWRDDGCDGQIFNLGSSARRYGISSIALLASKGGSKNQIPPSEPIDYEDLADLEISFNVLDPLNTAGSLVGNLDPNSMGFLKNAGISVSGKAYHRSRAVVLLNEKPIYLEYSQSAFGYTGRSVYQRPLYPLKSFIKTMITDEMVATKAGVIVAAMQAAGSIINQAMQRMMGVKRNIVKESATNNVISITPEERIESLNLQNVNAAMAESRKNIINNIAAADDMPAIILNSETYVAGFGEGSEDANNVARYIQGKREELGHVYDWFDPIIMHRAWNKEFYETIQAEFPDEYGGVDYKEAFFRWKKSFRVIWPSLIQEPPSEKIDVADKKLKALIALIQVLLPEVDAENKMVLIKWAQGNFNELEDLFTVPLDLDFEAMLADLEEKAAQAEQMGAAGGAGGDDDGEEEGGDKEPPQPKPFATTDAQGASSLRRVLQRRAA